MVEPSPQVRLNGFLAKFLPEIAALGRAVHKKMRNRLPGAFEMVYDNYNALVIGFSPTERPSEAVFSIVIYPRKVALCFIWGATLKDPQKILRGGGKQVRNILLESAADLEKPAVRSLVAQAMAEDWKPVNRTRRNTLTIRLAMAKHRPRRPRALG